MRTRLLTALSGLFLVCLLSLSLNSAKAQMVITEINFNPPESGTDSLEFIEWYNSSASSVDLVGYQLVFGGATRYTFPSTYILPSNGIVVFALNPDAVQRQYSLGFLPIDWGTVGVSNSTTTVRILDGTNAIIDEVTYLSSWQPSANGSGKTLIYCPSALDNSVSSSWGASAVNKTTIINAITLFGSPGSLECNTTWNGTTWSGGTPSTNSDAIIASNTAPANFTTKTLAISSTFALNTTGITATVNGNITNNGNGVIGTGNLAIGANSSLSGNAISFLGNLTVGSGATLSTGGLLTLACDAVSAGSLGNSAGSVSGNVTVQRYIPGGRRAYRFLSHPFTANLPMSELTDNIDITGTGGSPFTATASNSPSAFMYDNSIANSSLTTDPGWTALAANSNFNAKTAYRILVRGTKGQTNSLNGGSYTPSAVTLDWAGELNQGSQVITLTNNGTNKEYNFIGNPYASVVDLSLVTKGSNINANFSVWNPNANTKGAYVTQAFSTPYRLPSGSAFFTQTAANTNNTITFTEASKSTGTPASLFRNNGTKEDRLVLEVNTLDGNYADKLEFFFDNNNTHYTGNNDELWDAEKMANPETNFYSFSSDGKKLAIDRRPLKDNDAIQLGFTNVVSAGFTLTVNELPTINTNYDLYLKDKWLNTVTKLEANTTLNIAVTNDAASQGSNRFELLTKLNKAVMPVLNTAFAVTVYPNPSTDNINITYEGLNEKEATSIRVLNAEGKTVRTMELGKVNAGKQLLNIKSFNNGVYTVQLMNGCNKQTQAIIKQ